MNGKKPELVKLWISNPEATGQVDILNGIIVVAPPIWRKFQMGHFTVLTEWLAKRGHVKVERLG